MSLFSRKNGTDNWNEVDAMLERMQLGIKVFEQERGCMPAAMLLDYDMFWRTLNSEHIMLKPGHVVEFDGVRDLRLRIWTVKFSLLSICMKFQTLFSWEAGKYGQNETVYPVA